MVVSAKDNIHIEPAKRRANITAEGEDRVVGAMFSACEEGIVQDNNAPDASGLSAIAFSIKAICPS